MVVFLQRGWNQGQISSVQGAEDVRRGNNRDAGGMLVQLAPEFFGGLHHALALFEAGALGTGAAQGLSQHRGQPDQAVAGLFSAQTGRASCRERVYSNV